MQPQCNNIQIVAMETDARKWNLVYFILIKLNHKMQEFEILKPFHIVHYIKSIR